MNPRIFVLLLLACASAAPQAFAQQAQPPAASPASQSDDVFEEFEASQGKIIRDGDVVQFMERVDLPVPRQNGVRVFADRLEINRKTRLLVATGNVSFTTPQGRLNADRIEFNIDDGTGVFYVASGFMTVEGANRAEYGNQDPNVYFYGDRIEKRGPKHYVISRGGFTTCVQPTPRWEIESNKITIRLDEYALAGSTVLRVKNVPVMYLPAMYYPLHDDQRSTGFLMPTFGASRFQGSALSNAFFWAIGRSQDATFFHDWFTRTGSGIGTEYRYLAGEGSKGGIRMYRLNQKEAVFERNGVTSTLPSLSSYQIEAALTQNLGRGLRAQADVQYFSNVSTQQLYQQNTYERSISSRNISGGLTGAFGPATLGGYYSRSEQFTNTTNSTVFGSTPVATANIAPTKLFGTPIYGSMNAEYLFQPNRRLQDGIVVSDESLARVDLAPTLRVPLSRLSYLSVTSNVVARQTYFSHSLDASGAFVDAPVTRRYLSLQTDIIGPVFSKIWDTPGSGYSDRMKHVIEPIFGLEYITEISNQARVPRTDSAVFAVGGAMTFTYGVVNRLLARTRGVDDARGSTREFLTVGVQQSFYSNKQSSIYDTDYASYSGRTKPVELSPVALTARVSPIPGFDANARVEYDVSGGGLQILTTGGTITSGPSSTNLSYSRQRFSPFDLSSFLTGSTTWRGKDGRMSAFYGLNWDIDAKYIYQQSFGASYLSQCCGVQADYQLVNFLPSTGSPIPNDRRLNFSFVLAGLGTFSNFFGLFGQP